VDVCAGRLGDGTLGDVRAVIDVQAPPEAPPVAVAVAVPVLAVLATAVLARVVAADDRGDDCQPHAGQGEDPLEAPEEPFHGCSVPGYSCGRPGRCLFRSPAGWRFESAGGSGPGPERVTCWRWG